MACQTVKNAYNNSSSTEEVVLNSVDGLTDLAIKGGLTAVCSATLPPIIGTCVGGLAGEFAVAGKNKIKEIVKEKEKKHCLIM